MLCKYVVFIKWKLIVWGTLAILNYKEDKLILNAKK